MKHGAYQPFSTFLIVTISISYLLPAMVAAVKLHSSIFPILTLNLAFGWTGFIWIICLFWAMKSNKKAVVGNKIEQTNQFLSLYCEYQKKDISDEHRWLIYNNLQ